jgi:hypothetical protein
MLSVNSMWFSLVVLLSVLQWADHETPSDTCSCLALFAPVVRVSVEDHITLG